MKGLKEVLKSQLGDVAFKEREDRETSEVKVEGFFDGDKITPLMRAATHEDPGELMNLLATSQARSSLFVKDSRGRTALDWARLVNNEMSVIALRKAMLTSINESRVEMVGNSVDLAERLRSANKDATRKLMEALKQRNSIAAMEIIVKAKELDRETIEEQNERDREDGIPEDQLIPYFVDAEDSTGFSPLMLAASWNMIEIVAVLVDLGANVEHKNRYGHTAFTWACTVGHADIVRLLLFHGANIHHKTLEGRAGLHYACLYLKARVVSVLLDNLFEKFSTYRVTHPKAAFDATRWTRYARMLEQFLDVKDESGVRPWELLPVLPPGHHVYDNAEAIFRPVLEFDDRSSRSQSEADSEDAEEDVNGESEKKDSAGDGKTTARPSAPSTAGTDKTEEDLSNVRPLSRANLDAHTRAQTPHTPAAGIGISEVEPFPDGPLVASVPLHLKPDGDDANADVTADEDKHGGPSNLPMSPSEKRRLMESSVLIDGELRPISRSNVQKSQSEKLREQLYSQRAVAKSAGGTKSGGRPLTGEFKPQTPGELIAQEKALREEAAGDQEFFDFDGPEGDNFSTVSLSTMSLPEWDQDTDNGHAEGLHGLKDSHSIGTGLPVEEETKFIGELFYNARNRIEEWRMSAAQEEELMKPVPCWLGCGFEEAVEGVAMHVRDLCPFRAKECRQCHGIYKFCELQDHMEKDCLKRKVGCSNAYIGCTEMIPFDFVFQHETLRCRYRKVPCRLNCGGQVPYCLRDDHEQNHCNKRPLECDKCHQMVHAALFGKHLKNECVERYVKCRISCGHSFKFKDLEAHEKDVCVQPCRWGCNRIIGPEQRRRLHELLACRKRPVECKNNCGMGGLTAEFLEEHDRQQCPEFKVRCPNGCGERVKRRHLEKHLDSWHGTCTARLVRCPSNLVGFRVLVVRDTDESTEAAILSISEKIAANSLESAIEAEGAKNVPCNETPQKVKIGTVRTRNDDGTVTTSKGRPTKIASDTIDASGDIGIVLKYKREASPMPSRTVHQLDGRDMLYVKFDDRHEWLDYWDQKVSLIPLKKVQGSAASAGHRHAEMKCQWIPFGQLNNHLNFDCCFRSVWIAGDADKNVVGAADAFHRKDLTTTPPKPLLLKNGSAAPPRVDALGEVDTRLDGNKLVVVAPLQGDTAFQGPFRGQQTQFVNSIEMASLRNEYDEFLVAPSTTVRCDFCAQQFAHDKLERHQKFDCSKVLVRCKLGCGARMPRNELDDHAKRDCMKRPLTCKACGQEGLWVDEIEDHEANHCPERIVECKLKCGLSIVAREEEVHRLHECDMRLITCTCKMIMPARDRDDHMIAECTNKPTLCSQGCGMTIPRDEMEFHIENLCAKKGTFFSRKIFCPVGCGLRLMRRDIIEHVSYYCKRRLTDCPFKCGQSVQYDKLRQHLYYCPKRPVCCEPGARQCTKLFFKWFYCDMNPGDPGGAGYDGTAPDGTTPLKLGQDMLELFDPSGSTNLEYESGSMEEISQLGAESAVGFVEENQDGPIMIANDGKGLRAQHTSGGARYGTATRAPFSAGDGKGCKTPLPKGASIYYDNGSVFFHAGLRMKGCKRHQSTALMSAIRSNELPLAEFIINACEGEDLELENMNGETALTIAARLGKVQFVELLCQGGAEINYETSSGKTALIEAVRAPVENIELIELLVKSGSLVAYKTLKHRRTAIDWARLLILPNTLRILELGRVVQAQTDELFKAISNGDQENIVRIIGDGDFFDPTAEPVLFRKMEEEVAITRKAHLDVIEIKKSMNNLTSDVENAREAVEKAAQDLERAHDVCEGVFEESDSLNLRISHLYVSYERIADTIVASDLEEISRMRTPDVPTRVAVFSFGIMLGVLDKDEFPENMFDMKSAKKWWPKLVLQLKDSNNCIRKLRAFSIARLLNDLNKPALDRARSLYRDLTKAILDDAGPSTRTGVSARIDKRASDSTFSTPSRPAPAGIPPNFQPNGEQALTVLSKAEQDKALARQIRKSDMTPDFIKSGKRSMGGHASWSRPNTAGQDEITHGGDSTQPAVVVPWGRRNVPDDTDDNKADLASEGTRRSALNKSLVTGARKHTEQSRRPERPKTPDDHYDPNAPLKDTDWDSDADEAGGGEWGSDGEWKPVRKKKERWWLRGPEREQWLAEVAAAEKAREDEETAKRKAEELWLYGETSPGPAPPAPEPEFAVDRPGTSQAARTELGPDIGLEDAAYNATLRDNASAHFVRCMLVLLKAADQLAINRASIKDMKVRTQQASQDKEDKRLIHQECSVKHSSAVAKRLTTEKILTDMMKYARFTMRKAKLYREKLRVYRLLNRVTLSGHTALSWAASLGNFQAVDELLSHGAMVGYNANLLHLSAQFIQHSYRLYRFITQARREQDAKDKAEDEARIKAKENSQSYARASTDAQGNQDKDSNSVASVGTNIAVAGNGDFEANNSALVIEKMFKLKEERASVLRKIRYFRTKMRFPVPEAAYRGNWQIIHRIYERRLFHFNFSHSWIFPAPPPPFIRIHQKYNAKPPKLTMFEMMTYGMNDMAAGQYVERQGWVGPNDPRDHFGECQKELTEMWQKIIRAQDLVKAERLKIRRLALERIKQRDAVPDMRIAIMERDYRKCVMLATECGVSIDMETPEGVTALIGSAEEDTGVPFYAPMTNDDGKPCLACEYLLDRTMFRPSVNLEVASGHNALIRACSLSRASVVEALLDRGADVDYVNKLGMTPLHYAATVGSFIVCRILLERGADVHARDPDGRTAYSIAEEYGFLPLMQQMGRHSTGFMGPVRPHRGRVDVFVRCPLGCGKSLDTSEVAFHSHECINRVVKCPRKCDVRLLMFKEVEHHLEHECSHRMVPCKHCGAEVEQRYHEKHFAENCGHREVDCVLGCGKMIKAVEMRKHLRFCLWRVVSCSQGCGAEIRVKDMLDHDRNYCENRKVPCPLACGAMITTRMTKHHMMAVCPKRMEGCKWCGVQFEFKDLEAHERICDVRQEQCPSGCGEMVVVGDPLVTHQAEYCKHRFVYCDMKCGQKVRYIDLPGHRNNVCNEREVLCPLKCKVDYSVPPLQQQVVTLTAKMVDIHKKFECPERPLQCFMCKDYVKSRDMDEHRHTLCPMRETPCRNVGCSKIVALGTREEHERKTCKFRMLSCPQGCGEDVPWIQHGRHMKSLCTWRRQMCPLGCGTSLKHFQLDAHMNGDCPRRGYQQNASYGGTSRPGSKQGERGRDISSRGGARPGTGDGEKPKIGEKRSAGS